MGLYRRGSPWVQQANRIYTQHRQLSMTLFFDAVGALERIRLSLQLEAEQASLASASPLGRVGITRRMLALMAQLTGEPAQPAPADDLESEPEAAKENLAQYDRLINLGAISKDAYAVMDR